MDILKKNKMGRKLIIETYGQGNAIIVLKGGKIIDLFIDPPANSKFYPPNTFVEAKIQRRISKRGGYFVKLPNGCQGFLKSKTNYSEGSLVVLLSKVFFDEYKPQTFTDKLKIISKYFILKLGKSGFSFSRKNSKNLNKEALSPILEAKVNDHNGIFIICRSRIAEICTKQFDNELEKILIHHNSITKKLSLNKIYCDGLAKRMALDRYDIGEKNIVEEEGVFERFGFWNKIDELCQKKYFIGNGSYLILEQTSSFFAIDVNSGHDLKISTRDLNLLASAEICWIIKVLGLGGKIIIDFIPCSKSEKSEIFEFIANFFFDDFIRNKIWGWTNGGAFELERERDKSPLKLLVQHN